jgi:hypothetical protein
VRRAKKVKVVVVSDSCRRTGDWYHAFKEFNEMDVHALHTPECECEGKIEVALGALIC